jgi:hypothetical protein
VESGVVGLSFMWWGGVGRGATGLSLVVKEVVRYGFRLLEGENRGGLSLLGSGMGVVGLSG